MIAALWSPVGKRLTSWIVFVMFIVILLLSRWFPGTDVVLNCIDSLSFLSFLLFFSRTPGHIKLEICVEHQGTVAV